MYHCTQTKQCVLGECNGNYFTLMVLNGSKLRCTYSCSSANICYNSIILFQVFTFLMSLKLCSPWYSYPPHLILNYTLSIQLQLFGIKSKLSLRKKAEYKCQGDLPVYILRCISTQHNKICSFDYTSRHRLLLT